MTFLPRYCQALDEHWPWKIDLPHLRLVSTTFNPSRLDYRDFERCGIRPPASVQGSASKRQAEYLAGRLCAREALLRATGIGQVPTIGEDRAPQWPSNSIGSITHSTGRAAAIAGRSDHYMALGIDIERLMPDVRAQKLASRILTDTECARFSQDLSDSPGKFLTLAFSLKESLFKALYPVTLQRFYFEHAELLSWHPEGLVRLRLLTDLSSEWVRNQELDAYFSISDRHAFSLIAVPNQQIAESAQIAHQ